MSNKQKTVARLSAIQALYQLENQNQTPEQTYQEFLSYHFPDKSHQDLSAPDTDLFKSIFFGILERKEDINELIKNNLPPQWHFDRLEMILKIILQAACYELISSVDLDAKIILNEYVNISSSYFSQKETVFVNGVLNTIARAHRPECFS